MRALFLLFTAISLYGCFSDTRTMPAVGVPGDIYVIMDSAQWRGPLGRTVDSLFSTDMPGLPRKEPIFKTRWINPKKFSQVLKRRRNLVIVMTLDKDAPGARAVRRLFTPASIEQIKNNPDEFSKTSSDVFATNQEVLYLYGRDENALRQNIQSKGTPFVSYFNQKEKVRLTRSLYKSGEVTGISEFLNKEFQCNLRVPFGYKLAEKQSNFVWARQINPKDDKNIFIYRRPYTSQKDFGRNELIAIRNEACRAYLFEDPEKPETYVLTETTIPFIPVTADTVNFNGNFAVQLRGLYRTNTMGMGGPFIGFALVDEGTQQFYYIEGFTFAPAKDQREIMRELETILNTFRTSKELTSK